ncbi:hypothetical protein [Mycolicibacterium litorale]|uniref:hypothetical protein n=1 Tax=Mycolicibacterium litorale TaxID=758802 RepID=UPI001064DB1A|nr:hypothetical protein [Mycolicibacterium litorale]MCV7418112.1 hypothetical protein [Mycolicibacterium litorale]
MTMHLPQNLIFWSLSISDVEIDSPPPLTTGPQRNRRTEFSLGILGELYFCFIEYLYGNNSRATAVVNSFYTVLRQDSSVA